MDCQDLEGFVLYAEELCTISGLDYLRPVVIWCLQVAKDVSQSLKNCINCLPGQKDVDEAIQRVSKASELLAAEDVSSFNSYFTSRNLALSIS